MIKTMMQQPWEYLRPNTWNDGLDCCKSIWFSSSTNVLLDCGLGASWTCEGPSSVLEDTSSVCVPYSSSDIIDGLDFGLVVLVPLREFAKIFLVYQWRRLATKRNRTDCDCDVPALDVRHLKKIFVEVFQLNDGDDYEEGRNNQEEEQFSRVLLF